VKTYRLVSVNAQGCYLNEIVALSV
jgi:hypothetical protein